jgi:arylsulfatase A-like enzyme
MKTKFLSLLGLAPTLLFAEQNKPNVIIFFTDDQGYADTNMYGSSDLMTPNMDRLCTEGVRFTQFYANSPQSSPSRASLMTGRYPQRVGLEGLAASKPEGASGLPGKEVTLPEMMKPEGYKTALVGKWHLGYKTDMMPVAQGFDFSFGHMGGCIDNYSHFYHWDGPSRHDLWENGDEVWRDGDNFSDLMLEKAKEFISENKNDPFFLYFSSNYPHYPLQGDKKWLDYYKNLPSPRNKYAAMVSTIDEKIGYVLDHLEKENLKENTILIFMSDNGYSTEERTWGGGGSAGPLRGAKFSCYEGGFRVPAIISYPKMLPQNEVREQIAMGADWLPTILDLCGITYDASNLDGKSLVNVLQSNTEVSPHQSICWKIGDIAAVRKGDWKLVRFSQKVELYNLLSDVGEKNDLASANPQIAGELSNILAAWEEDVKKDKPGQTLQQDALSIIHSSAGSLSSEINAVLAGEEASSVKFLAVSGAANLNYDDCRTIVTFFPNLVGLDLFSITFPDGAIPDAVNNVGAFEGLTISGIRFKDSTPVVGTRAFANCPNLSSVTLTGTVKSEAFTGCPKLSLVYFKSNTFPVDTQSDAFGSSVKFYVPWQRAGYYNALGNNVQDGTPEKKYIMSTPDDVRAVTAMTMANNATSIKEVYVELSNNVDMSGWIENHPDADVRSNGWKAEGDDGNRFSGYINGNGHFILNLWTEGRSVAGLFNRGRWVKFEKLGVTTRQGKSFKSTTSFAAGFVADFASVELSECCFIGNIDAGSVGGGLLGYTQFSTGTPKNHITNSYACGEIKGVTFAGGLIGQTKAPNVEIKQSYANAIIQGANDTGSAAGIVGGVSGGSTRCDGLFVLCSDINAGKRGSLSTYATGDLQVTDKNYYLSSLSSYITETEYNGTAKTAEEMLKDNALFDVSGWDMNNIWYKKNGNYPAPVLKSLDLACQPSFTQAHLAFEGNPIPVNVINNNGLLHVYPNPTEGILNLSITEPLQITLYNENGQLLESEIVGGIVDLSSYPVGVYYLKSKEQSLKIIKK